LDQFKAMLDDLALYERDMPAIIMGDLNTWEAKAGRKTAELFSEAGWTTPFDGQATFSRRILMVPIKFKLDWVWLRGLEAVNFGIDRTIKVSDHWPLWTNIRIATPPRNVSGQ
jgi:endonuclease/exonuclease/phosphatase family metal-dependent hydrolase